MSMTDAEAFLDRAETDAAWGAEFEAIKDDQEAVLAKVHAAGYDVTQQEVLDAFMERYGAELTPEQLDQIAAGADAELIAGAVVGGVVGVGVVVGVCAAFAA
jgi:predicted ribosomally synthesized peptide with nif11-like leader